MLVHREGVNPNSMNSVNDLCDHKSFFSFDTKITWATIYPAVPILHPAVPMLNAYVPFLHLAVQMLCLAVPMIYPAVPMLYRAMLIHSFK